MRFWHCLPLILAFAITTSPRSRGQETGRPEVRLEGWKIERVVSEPELVTPVGCTFDSAGRLLVIESHTHFPPEGYAGPKTDRIYRFDDSDGDGVLDRQQLFYEGGVATMGLAVLPDDWVVVATRSEVIKIRDADGDGVAEEKEVLLTHQTESQYPHNGLAGLTLGPDGVLYVGQGENLGESYSLIAADRSRQVGGGEGGNVFRVAQDGSSLERFATGFWNPFSLHFDQAGRLWTVGNDPDSMPPCRLLHVVEGGDYGFQFRFGRPGTHPLQSWNGELPGTLPMAAGTGEAPCAVAQVGDALWVTSWGSNRVERYQMQDAGATLTGKMDVVVQGGPMFRPVGMAVSDDRSIYLTDWVDRSYPVHGKGRLWRLSPIEGGSETKAGVIADLTDIQKNARQLARDASVSKRERMSALENDDPFVRQAAVTGLVRSGQIDELSRASATSTRQRVGLITAWRWRELCHPDSVSAEQRQRWLAWGLADESPEVAIAALRWATERKCVPLSDAIEALLNRDNLTPTLLSGTIASLAFLRAGTAKEGAKDAPREKLLYDIATDSQRAPRIRSLAIAMLPAKRKRPDAEELARWVAAEKDRRFGGEIVRLLVQRGEPADFELLAALAADESLEDQVRADAIGGLSRNAGPYSRLLNRSSIPSRPDAVRTEAKRVLKRVRSQGANDYPPLNDKAGWEKLTGTGGDPQAGRRVFFRTTCANCHAHSGRGSKVGPDMTNLTGHMTRARLVESILMPSREVGPLFVTWKVLTVDGKILTGMKLDRPGRDGALRLLGAEGGVFEIALDDIEDQSPDAASIMPTGLEQTMSPEEFRDLIAFLVDPVWE